MDTVRWYRLQDIVDGALDLGSTEYDAHLKRVCRRPDGSLDLELLHEAQSLLAAYEQADITEAVIGPFADLAATDTLSLSRIGALTVERQCVSGGMADVYLAIH